MTCRDEPAFFFSSFQIIVLVFQPVFPLRQGTVFSKKTYKNQSVLPTQCKTTESQLTAEHSHQVKIPRSHLIFVSCWWRTKHSYQQILTDYNLDSLIPSDQKATAPEICIVTALKDKQHGSVVTSACSVSPLQPRNRNLSFKEEKGHDATITGFEQNEDVVSGGFGHCIQHCTLTPDYLISA